MARCTAHAVGASASAPAARLPWCTRKAPGTGTSRRRTPNASSRSTSSAAGSSPTSVSRQIHCSRRGTERKLEATPMEAGPVLPAWPRILSGYRPNLTIEIPRECPLRCPGCYAYGEQHLGGSVVLRELADFKGQELIDHVIDVIDPYRDGKSVVEGE